MMRPLAATLAHGTARRYRPGVAACAPTRADALSRRMRGGIAASSDSISNRSAGDGRPDEAHRNRIAEPIGLSAGVADERMGALLVTKIFIAQGRGRNEAVGAGVVELDEQAGSGDAADAPLEDDTDAIGKEMGDQAIDGLALGHHGAPLGGGNARGNFTERTHGLGSRQAVVAELEGADQGAMDDEVRVAPDRRGEVGVPLEVQAEMAVISAAYGWAWLRHHFVDRFSVSRPLTRLRIR